MPSPQALSPERFSLILISGWNQNTEEHLVASINEDIDYIERAQGVNTKAGSPAFIIGIHDLIFQAILKFAIITCLIYQETRCTE
jgi:hypothetical protein